MDGAGRGPQELWPRPETVVKVLGAVIAFHLFDWAFISRGDAWYSFWGELGNSLWLVVAWAVGVRVWRGG